MVNTQRIWGTVTFVGKDIFGGGGQRYLFDFVIFVGFGWEDGHASFIVKLGLSGEGVYTPFLF